MGAPPLRHWYCGGPVWDAQGPAATTSVPVVAAKSLVEVAAFTPKVVVPDGVDNVAATENVAASPTSLIRLEGCVVISGAPEVLMVSVACFDALPDANETGFGLKEAVAPAGNDVVRLSTASNAPLEPPPVPRFTVIVYAAFEPPVTGVGDCALTDTEPTFGPSVNVVCARIPDVPPVAVSTKRTPMSCGSGAKSWFVKFPEPSATAASTRSSCTSGSSCTSLVTVSPGAQPVPVIITVVP